MVTSLVLMSVERDSINAVAEKLVEIDGVSEVFSVAGQYDLVAMIRVPSNEALADVVTSKMLQIDGILTSETLIAFKVFSRHDLESMFSVGLD
ncbi:MAG: Lrp/AsnC ligand binding domain-containing protein [Anaerolineales bacterium]|nr:Lrp/AsnC ligand binding domain-containing protein [Anaerolineales bacterium]MCB8962939.1 Lrp/AsnC ligand binding domain-containing protein [Ardenticatenales bacterium]